MARLLKPIYQKQFLVTLGSLKAYFNKATAPSETRDTVDYNDGQTGTTFVHAGFTKRDTVTLSKVFDPSADKELIAFYVKQTTEEPTDFNVSIQPVSVELQGKPIAGAGTFLLNNCQFVGAKLPEADRSGSGMAMLEFTLTFDSWTYQ